MSKYGVFSGPYFPGFGLYSVRLRENVHQKNLRIWKLLKECEWMNELMILNYFKSDCTSLGVAESKIYERYWYKKQV